MIIIDTEQNKKIKEVTINIFLFFNLTITQLKILIIIKIAAVL